MKVHVDELDREMPEIRKVEMETKKHNRRIKKKKKLTPEAARNEMDPWEACVTDVEGQFGKVRCQGKGQGKKGYEGTWGPENRQLTQGRGLPKEVCQGLGRRPNPRHIQDACLN